MMDSATVKWWELQHLSNKWFTSRYNASQILKGVLGFAEDLDWHRFTMGIKKTIYLKKDEPDSPPLLNLVTSFCVDSHWRSWLCCYNCQLVKVEKFQHHPELGLIVEPHNIRNLELWNKSLCKCFKRCKALPKAAAETSVSFLSTKQRIKWRGSLTEVTQLKMLNLQIKSKSQQPSKKSWI